MDRALSFDGGGIRGLVTPAILKRLQAGSRRRLHTPLATLLPALLDRAFKGEL